MKQVLWVFLGGGIGSVMRYFLGILTIRAAASSLPVGTFLANLISCTILAAFIYLTRGESSGNTRLFLITGLCGGLSTFSAFGWETIQLLQQGKTLAAAGNIVVNLCICLPLIWLASQKSVS